jgi:hypothetical protein
VIRDEWDAQQRICVWCLPKKHPDTGEPIEPRHDLCIGRWEARYCECACPWLTADMTQHFPSWRG